MTRHGVGEYNLKLVYPEIFERLENPSAGFSAQKKGYAQKLGPGQKVFIYVCEYQLIIGLAEPTGYMVDRGRGQWRYDVPLRWVIGPCAGVTLKEAKLSDVIRPMDGDTNFILTEEESNRLMMLLKNKKPIVMNIS